MRRRVFFALAGVMFMAWFSLSVINAQQKNPNPDKLRALLTNRRDVLRERVNNARAEYEIGEESFQLWANATELLLNAELELATSPQQRLEIYQKRIDHFRGLEKHAAVGLKFGTISTNEKLMVTADRLQAEIDRAREEASLGR